MSQPLKANRRYGCQTCGKPLDKPVFAIDGQTTCSETCRDALIEWGKNAHKIYIEVTHLERQQSKGVDGTLFDAFVKGFLMGKGIKEHCDGTDG